MRMMLVVILKPFRQLLQHVAGIVERLGIDITPPERLDEGLGHPVGLGAVVRCRSDHEPQGAVERDDIPGDIGRAVVAEPLDCQPTSNFDPFLSSKNDTPLFMTARFLSPGSARP